MKKGKSLVSNPSPKLDSYRSSYDSLFKTNKPFLEKKYNSGKIDIRIKITDKTFNSVCKSLGKTLIVG